MNFSAGQTIANATTVTLGALTGGVFIQNAEPVQTHTDVIVDVFGYYSVR